MRRPARPGIVLVTAMTLGPMFVWAGHFGLVYLVDHMACTAFASSAVAWARPAMIVITLPILGLLLAWAWKGPSLIARRISRDELGALFASMVRLLAMLAILAVLWTAAATLVLPVCEGLR